jgi:hypothetical protein
MKKALIALAAVLAAVTASAAEGGPQIGLGAAASFGETRINVPINIAPGLRVEPFLGFDRAKETDGTNPAGDVITTHTRFELGAGAYVVKEAAQNVELYGGGRIELDFISAKVETPAGDASDSFVGFGLAAVGGAEYYFSPRFALGVEAELGVHTEETSPDVRQTDIFTASFVTAKVFFK